MKKLIKKILKENVNVELLNVAVNYLKTGGPPYFYKLRQLDINKKSEVKKVLKQILPNLVYIDGTSITDKSGNEIYYESHPNFYEDDEDNFDWDIREYDKNGNLTYEGGTDDGILTWVKYEYDENGNEVSWKDSDGNWRIFSYDKNGNLNYEEDSLRGVLTDER